LPPLAPILAVLLLPWLGTGCDAARGLRAAWRDAVPREDPAVGRARAEARLAGARRLLVQLQHLSFGDVEAADPDVIVVDYSWDGGGNRELTRADVWRLRERPGRPPRVVLAYLSIGEAESYRWYWERSARGGRARFVIGENPKWAGNFRVRYWDPAWRSVLAGGRGSYLARILDAGFDGVFLDTVDAAEALEEAGDAGAAGRMAALVTDLAQAARGVDPAFLVVAQNPFRILGEPGVADALSGVVAEAHLYDGDEAVPDERARPILDALRSVRDRGKRVLVIEYVCGRAAIDRLSALCAAERFLCYVGSPALSRVGVILDPGPGPAGAGAGSSL
jgi:cysteinyl-tRNA synthetase